MTFETSIEVNVFSAKNKQDREREKNVWGKKIPKKLHRTPRL